MFKGVKGHKVILGYLTDLVLNDAIKGFYLFKGPPGIGKLKVARLLSKYLLCEKEKKDDCNCFSCKNFPNVLNFYELNKGKEGILVEDVVVLEDLFKNNSVRRKVLIINNLDNLNYHASNKLLKLFEDYVDNITVFLVTNREYKIIKPLLSRCNVVKFSFLEKEYIFDIIKSLYNCDVDEELVKMSYFFVESLLERYNDYKECKSDVIYFFEKLMKKDIVNVMTVLRKYDEKKDLNIFMDVFLIFVCDLLKVGLNSDEDIFNESNRLFLREISDKWGVELCTFVIEKTRKIKMEMESNSNVSFNGYSLVLSCVMWIIYFLERREVL